MQAQPCFCAGVLRCGRDFGFDTGPSWRAVAHAPGPHGSAAVREPSIPFTGALRVFVALEACDMRKGFDGLSGLARAGDKSICRAASQFPNILKLQTLGTIDPKSGSWRFGIGVEVACSMVDGIKSLV